MEYYEISQGKTYKDRWITPDFPITDKGLAGMIETGLAKYIGNEEKEYRAPWGSGIFRRVEKDTYELIDENWDTSG